MKSLTQFYIFYNKSRATNNLVEWKRSIFVSFLIVITNFLLGIFGVEYSVYGKELTDGKTDEQNVDDKNTGEDISGNVTTFIKDKSIQRLPTTGEKLRIFLMLVGVFLLVVVLGMKNKKIFVKSR
ncbi:LPXTG cell wall anchor domain-containing protein [Carnobacterium maltaromaticum]|nr:LPXTG cell wall anchor domain-containing protein [Carnobacterium maltaromaticum]